ncbi:hypothetical protein CHCC14820_3228 [Bacillus paralicheniformis]|uniref:Uncharacterized protein n=1 Tax=Bacillus paralicheniformis TaxID=1648923 RepID=A0A6I7THG2_9BACI|nr:hypothetical protein SC10_B2orf02633 [Bacillus paralicheniformis]OLF87595.1 hypothetical protein B4121_4047 [Bacillus paralicheniformis]OLG07089.1 hypothetical protein B4125_1270 [Bacillus paralicheniformis]TWJ55354.1 hypothetical protein CHCC5023_2552 [Bacillus paralicheniformis]TWJ76441.1 hypothetical protein CHCC4186_3633 [Bacillus paralicheniformis]
MWIIQRKRRKKQLIVNNEKHKTSGLVFFLFPSSFYFL